MNCISILSTEDDLNFEETSEGMDDESDEIDETEDTFIKDQVNAIYKESKNFHEMINKWVKENIPSQIDEHSELFEQKEDEVLSPAESEKQTQSSQPDSESIYKIFQDNIKNYGEWETTCYLNLLDSIKDKISQKCSLDKSENDQNSDKNSLPDSFEMSEEDGQNMNQIEDLKLSDFESKSDQNSENLSSKPNQKAEVTDALNDNEEEIIETSTEKGKNSESLIRENAKKIIFDILIKRGKFSFIAHISIDSSRNDTTKNYNYFNELLEAFEAKLYKDCKGDMDCYQEKYSTLIARLEVSHYQYQAKSSYLT